MKGQIISREGNQVKVQDTKTGAPAVVVITDNTNIERNQRTLIFNHPRHMDVTAMLPGLTIKAKGVGNSSGQLEASKISFTTKAFPIDVAQQQQITANQVAVAAAQSTANQGVAAAGAAQTSADQAQASANQAGTAAATANSAAAANATAVQMVNKRVSDLDDYTTVSQAVVYYPTGRYTINDAGKADLDKLATLASSTHGGYLIEIAGYASKPGSKDFNQKLSERRAAEVAQYLLIHGNVPMRRIVMPAGYGSSQSVAANGGPQSNKLSRRVDVRLIVNNGVQKSSEAALTTSERK